MGTCETTCIEMPAARMSFMREGPMFLSFMAIDEEIMLSAGEEGEMESWGLLER